MVVKAYVYLPASCPQRVLLCFLEKEIEFELIHVDLDTWDHKKPEHLLRQPFGKVPAIEDGDLKLYESRAILRYYATKYADQGTDLLGKTLEQRAIVDQWMETETNHFNAVGLPIVVNLVVNLRLGVPCDDDVVKEQKVKLGTILDIYENRLATNRYLAGDEFTLADLTHMPMMNMPGFSSLITSRPNLNRWWNEVTARPSWKKLMEMVANYVSTLSSVS